MRPGVGEVTCYNYTLVLCITTVLPVQTAKPVRPVRRFWSITTNLTTEKEWKHLINTTKNTVGTDSLLLASMLSHVFLRCSCRCCATFYIYI